MVWRHSLDVVAVVEEVSMGLSTLKVDKRRANCGRMLLVVQVMGTSMVLVVMELELLKWML